MGTPPSSLNCLVGGFFLTFAPDSDAMRVPRPAAGMMTNTFIGAISIVQTKRSPLPKTRLRPPNSERWNGDLVGRAVDRQRRGLLGRVGRESAGSGRGRYCDRRRRYAFRIVAATSPLIPLAENHLRGSRLHRRGRRGGRGGG